MDKIDSFIGKKFGMLTIVSVSHRDSYSRPIYNTLCDCGNTSTSRRDSLRGGTKSCGCYGKRKYSNSNIKKKVVSLKQRNNRYKQVYGITLIQYNQMLTDQNGLCKICNTPEISPNNWKDGVRNLSVDHCHSTGKIRGLLCSACNTTLGKIKDNTTTLQRMIDYLKDSND